MTPPNQRLDEIGKGIKSMASGKVSGAPLLKNTRLPVDAIKAILHYRAEHQLQAQALKVFFDEAYRASWRAPGTSAIEE